MTERLEILVVEDSPTQRQRLVLILEQGGYTVTAAGGGAEALAILQTRRPALVISDIIMPGMDGYALCRRIKENPEFAGLPVILVTYLSDIHDVVRGVEAGADNFVMKPFTADFLLGRVRRTLAVQAEESPAPGGDLPLRLDGREYLIRSDRRQAVEILLSIYETALQKQQRLHASQEDLRIANQELEAFSYSVSHDLRTPLSVILGFSEFLLGDFREVLGEKGREQLQMIRQSAQKMESLIRDLLNLSRATRAELTRETVDLSALAGEIAQDLRRQDPQRLVDVHVESGMVTRGDAALLRIALENLLRNAWKFTSRKERARIEVGWEDGERPVYYVRDNGAGFPMQEADRLFTSFQRLHAAADFPGTGLGLTIVQRIIARHRGRIWAEGRVDEGAVFRFTLGG